MVVAMLAAVFMVVVMVVAAFDAGIERQRAFQVFRNTCVRITAYAAEQLNLFFRQCGFRAAADAAADYGGYAVQQQEISQKAMAAAIGRQDFRSCNSTILNGIYLKFEIGRAHV